jgi:5S rRNA maturation endonuclease (ribonuclease M5)
MINKREKAYQAFGSFVVDFIRDLNHKSDDGWALLVEGARDERAMRLLGYKGTIITVASHVRKGSRAFQDHENVVILTDLDREGAALAARFTKSLSRDGLLTSLGERRRLKSASKGVFLHIENLSRFSETIQA